MVDLESVTRRVRWTLLIGAAALFFGLFLGTFFPVVTVTVSIRQIGDVTGVLSAAWRAVTGTASLLSVFLAVRSYRSEHGDGPSTDAPNTHVQVEGDLVFKTVVDEEGRTGAHESEESTDSSVTSDTETTRTD